MTSRKIIVVGSGVAGMAAAIRLAVQGFEVAVYEKSSGPGGKLTAFEKDGFKFDAGPSLFTQPENITALFELAGEAIDDYFAYKSLSITCNYFFENGKQVQAPTDVDSFAAVVERELHEPATSIKKYLADAAITYNNIGAIFLNHSLHKKSTWLNKQIFKALATVRPHHIFGSLHKYNTKQLRTPEAVQLFNRYATYNGSNPYKAPGMLSVIPHLEFNQGTYYPNGGMISITNALYKLAIKKGVQFYFNTPVQKIIHHEGIVKGVVVNDENVMADIVVSNSDIYFTQQHLLNNTHKAKKILKQERSSSALVFYWGIKKEFSQLGLHNIFFSQDYAAEFNSLFKKKSLYTDPTVYINITSKMEAGMAPQGHENWFVMINAPAHAGQPWQQWQEQVKQHIISKLSRMLQTDIAPLIVSETVLTPEQIEINTSSYQGALYGTSSNSKWAAFLRHPNFVSTVKNLYCCGGTVHPGGGIPLCLQSAKIVSDLIQHTKIKRH
jgi:phytoene desaturase